MNLQMCCISEHKAPEPGPQACPLRLSAFQRPILQLPRWGSYLPRPENQNVVYCCITQMSFKLSKDERILRLAHEMIYIHGSEDIRSQYCCNNCQYPKSIVFLEHLKNPHCKTLYKDYSLHCLDSLGICRLRTF